MGDWYLQYCLMNELILQNGSKDFYQIDVGKNNRRYDQQLSRTRDRIFREEFFRIFFISITWHPEMPSIFECNEK